MKTSRRIRVEVLSDDPARPRVQRFDDIVAIEARTDDDSILQDLAKMGRVALRPKTHLLLTDSSGEVHEFAQGEWFTYQWQEVA